MIAKLKIAVLAIATLLMVSACVQKPTTVSLNFTASAGANGGLPVKATVYYLASPGKFAGADYFAISASPEAILGADLIKSESVLLSPGQSKTLSASFDAGGPVAVGVVVGFMSLDSAKWKATAAVAPGSANLMTVAIDSASVNITQ